MSWSRLPQGEGLIDLRVVDMAGNDALAQVPFLKDSVAPGISFERDRFVSRTPGTVIRWDAWDNESGIARVSVVLGWVSSAVPEDVTDASEMRLEDLYNGRYTMTFIVEDAAGNVVEEKVSFEVDAGFLNERGATTMMAGLVVALTLVAAIAVVLFVRSRGRGDESP